MFWKERKSMSPAKTAMTIVPIIILSLLVFTMAIEAAETISFQGFLADDTGSPVPDGSYSIRFRLFNDPIWGNQLWFETHPSVQTTGGRFTVQLGSIDSISTEILQEELLALEIKVGSDPPMTPRIILTSSPRSRVSRRVYGDIRTTRHTLQLHPPEPGCPDSCYMVKIVADSSEGSFRMYVPQGGTGGNLSHPVVELLAGQDGGTFNMYKPTDLLEVAPFLAINSSPETGLSIRGFNPQPEPPASPVDWFEINTTPGGGPSLVMFNPQPEPPASDPWLDMHTDMSGPSFKMTAEQAAVSAQITDPMLEMKADSTGPEFNLKKKFQGPTGGPDSTTIRLTTNPSSAELTMFGGGTQSNPSISMYADQNGGKLAIGTAAITNILTVQQFSSTDPVADAWTTYSSRRWKSDIRTIDHALDKVMALRGVSYKWKQDGRRDIGLVAEEVGEIIPEVVAYEENGIDAQSVDYSRLVALLIEATKEQQRTIEDLQRQIEELKSRSDHAALYDTGSDRK